MLVVWKLDRLARSLKQLIATVEDLENRGIQFQSITEGLDTTSAGGKLVFHIMGAQGATPDAKAPDHTPYTA